MNEYSDIDSKQPDQSNWQDFLFSENGVVERCRRLFSSDGLLPAMSQAPMVRIALFVVPLTDASAYTLVSLLRARAFVGL